MDRQFLEAVFTDSIQHPNFFNGRILTATDLRDEQAANLQRSRYLGQAIGSGVVYGLAVSPGADQSSLVITAGLAVNRRGDGLHLPGTTTVELVLTEPLGNPTSPFVPCDVAAATTLTGKVSTGYYLLAIASATRLSVTMAPNSGLNGDRPGCTNRYEEVGVQFKLVPLTNDDFISPISPTEPDSRSRLAHVCFGTNLLQTTVAQPRQQPGDYGLVAALHQDGRLTDCDVPLAVFRFQSSSLQFVDRWAVRRLATPGQHANAYLGQPFGAYVGTRWPAEAAAFLLQFQDHLEDLRTSSTVTPATVVAADYFEYLPAAGYLPIQVSSSDRRFRVSSFFGGEIPAQPLEPELLRSLFHESLYAEPIRPGIDDVDIYQVTGAATTEAYRIFVRRAPIVLPPKEPEAPPDDTPTPAATGDLYVAVLSTQGQAIDPEYIQVVQATRQTTGQIYTAKRSQKLPTKSFRQNQYEVYLQQAKAQTQEKYLAIEQTPQTPGKPIDDIAIATRDPGVYFFNDLPADTYTVKAIPTQNTYYGVAIAIKVQAKLDNFATVTLRQRSSKLPKDMFVPDDYLLPDGIIVDGYWVAPRWPDYYREWEEDLFGPNSGVIDPPPDAWVKRDDLEVGLQLEELLERQGIDDPRVATAGAVIYIRNDYNPAQPGETVTAFVQTPDGSRFPAVMLAADNALDKPASVDRSEIPDFDRATVDRLENVGLAGMDAIASAPTKLVAGVLGQSLDYSASLITDAQTSLQNDFRDGYLGYAGISKAQSDALKNQFGGKVDLANANATDIAAALGENVNSSFANRFLADVRSSVPTTAFDLGATGIDAAGQTALADIGVASNKDLRERGATEAGRAELQQALGVGDATLERYLETATLGFASGELATTPEKSIGTLENVPTDLKATLASNGIGSAKDLANADPAALATLTGVSVNETTQIVDAAAPYGSTAHLTLISGASQGAIASDQATAAGLTSAGAIARKDTASLETAGLDASTAQMVKNLSSQLLSGGAIRRFR